MKVKKSKAKIVEVQDSEEAIQSLLSLFSNSGHIVIRPFNGGMAFDKNKTKVEAKDFDGVSLGMVIHEMAHFVEIEDDRLGLKDFGLPWESRRKHHTDAAVRRELRVLALQKNACKALGVEFDMAYEAENLQNVPGWEIHIAGYESRRWDIYKRTILAPKIRRLAQQERHQFDYFVAEWHRRIALIEAEPERIR